MKSKHKKLTPITHHNTEALINADKCTNEIADRIPYKDRVKMAENFGPNWACILSGCGDQ